MALCSCWVLQHLRIRIPHKHALIQIQTSFSSKNNPIVCEKNPQLPSLSVSCYRGFVLFVFPSFALVFLLYCRWLMGCTLKMYTCMLLQVNLGPNSCIQSNTNVLTVQFYWSSKDSSENLQQCRKSKTIYEMWSFTTYF